ncbi:hypothetical protein ACJJTC_010224 [Scirpophaga incertulas]
MLKCTLCHLNYHIKCIPLPHRENFDSDDENDGFVCVSCYNVTNDSDSDISSQFLFDEYCMYALMLDDFVDSRGEIAYPLQLIKENAAKSSSPSLDLSHIFHAISLPLAPHRCIRARYLGVTFELRSARSVTEPNCCWFFSNVVRKRALPLCTAVLR